MDWEYLIGGFVNILTTAGAVVFVVFFFGMAIFVHELGHFLVARWRGLHVDAFSIGFKKVWSKKVNGIEYRIGCLPFGGYVELPQVDATGTPKSADGVELPKAKPVDRMLTAVAGPLCNIIFGLFMGCFVWWIGIPMDTPKMRVIEVAQIVADSPEYRAGLRTGDKIVKLNGKPFYGTWQNFFKDILVSIGEVTLEVERDGKTLQITYLPAVNPNVLQVEQTAYPFFRPRIPIELHPEGGASVAARAGIRAGDRLLTVNGMEFENFAGVQQLIDLYGDKPLNMTLRRPNGEEYSVELQPVERDDALDFMTLYYAGCSFKPDELLVVGLMKDFPAQIAGVRLGDRVKAFNGKPVKSFQPFFEAVQGTGGKPFELTVERDGKELTLTLSAKAVRPRSIGVAFMLRDHPTPIQQFTYLVDLTAKSLRGIGVFVGNKLGLTEAKSHIKPRNMSGPAGMAWVLYNSVLLSPMLGIYFVVLISFALAIFNLLPLPVLDGGHIFLALIEIIFRRPLPAVIVGYLSYLFIGLLITLMLYVTCFDFLRIFTPNGMGAAKPATATAPAKAPEAGK